MTQLRWSPEAVTDLESIRDFIARDSEHYALLVIQRLVVAVERLAEFPTTGRFVPELTDQSLRELIVGAHRVVYRLNPDAVEVVTIFRTSRLFPETIG